jgi:short chain dehydrogenase
MLFFIVSSFLERLLEGSALVKNLRQAGGYDRHRIFTMNTPKNSIARFALVTGTSTGIGKATSLRLAAEGVNVFAGVRRSTDGDALLTEASRISELRPVSWWDKTLKSLRSSNAGCQQHGLIFCCCGNLA